MVAVVVTVVCVLLALALIGVASSARVVKQYERGVVLRLGRLRKVVRDPGFVMLVPLLDRLRKVNMQIVTMPIPAQEGITRDNVTVRVDAVVYFKVVDPASAVIDVADYQFAVSQMAQTSLRSIIGKSELDDLLSNREKLNQGLELMIDSPAVGWGVQVDRVEIKDVSLPETMKRSMARQAEADRERRARVINADAEFQASQKLAEAAHEMAREPAALQLRLLQTVVAVAAEKNSTLVLPFPVELLRFLERAQQPGNDRPTAPADGHAPTPSGHTEGSAPGAARAPDEASGSTGATPYQEPLPEVAAGPTASGTGSGPGGLEPAELDARSLLDSLGPSPAVVVPDSAPRNGPGPGSVRAPDRPAAKVRRDEKARQGTKASKDDRRDDRRSDDADRASGRSGGATAARWPSSAGSGGRH
nr:slipin family protein [Actinacidiphila yeochonensis]